MKTTFGALLVSGLHPLSLLHALAKPKEVVREFRFSASPAKVNLGVGRDFLAWTYNGLVVRGRGSHLSICRQDRTSAHRSLAVPTHRVGRHLGGTVFPSTPSYTGFYEGIDIQLRAHPGAALYRVPPQSPQRSDGI